MFEREQTKLDAQWLRMLLAVRRHRILSRNTVHMLSINGLISFGSPSETCQYNHWRLTTEGGLMLARLEAKC